MIIVTFEGLDKSGKRTQSELLCQSLHERGYDVKHSEFHRYDTPTGKLIRSFLDGEYNPPQLAMECIMAADKYAQLDWFKELEAQGCDVLILDRYIGSQIVYGLANGTDIDFLCNILDKLPEADFEFFLDVSVEESMQRKGQHGDNDKYESNKAMLEDARDRYFTYMHLRESLDQAMTVDGMRDVQEIHQEILERILSLLEEEVK